MPILEPKSIGFISNSVDQTSKLGFHLGRLLRAGDVLCLSGNLGAGKTALTRGIGFGWGAEEHVTSPTFTLIHEHRHAADATVLYHVDCYRLSGADEAWGIGLEDLLHGTGIIVMEWPENILEMLPEERLWINLALLDDTRRHITLKATGERYIALIDTLRQNTSGK